MNRDGYRDQIVTCDVDVSLHSKTHPLLGTPHARAIMQHDGGARTRALWRGPESRGGSLDGHYVAPARSVTAKVPGMYYIVPRLHLPSLRRWSQLPGRLVKMTYSLNDIWIYLIMMSLGLYSNAWLRLIIIGTQVVDRLT